MFTSELLCLIAGPIIAGLVQLFKSWIVAAKYPKVFALALSIIVAVVSGLTIGSFDWAAIAQCVVVPFATAVATYEVVKTTAE